MHKTDWRRTKHVHFEHKTFYDMIIFFYKNIFLCFSCWIIFRFCLLKYSNITYWGNITRKCYKEISDKLSDNEVRIEQTGPVSEGCATSDREPDSALTWELWCWDLITASRGKPRLFTNSFVLLFYSNETNPIMRSLKYILCQQSRSVLYGTEYRFYLSPFIRSF